MSFNLFFYISFEFIWKRRTRTRRRRKNEANQQSMWVCVDNQKFNFLKSVFLKAFSVAWFSFACQTQSLLINQKLKLENAKKKVHFFSSLFS